MAKRIEAFGQLVEFPDDMTDDDIVKAIRNNEHDLNPNWEPPKPKPEVLDYAKGFASGANQLVSGIGYLAEKAGAEKFGKAARAFGDRGADYWNKQMSAGGRRIAGEQVFIDDPDSSLGVRLHDEWGKALMMGASQSLPSMFAAAIPGGLAAKGIQKLASLGLAGGAGATIPLLAGTASPVGVASGIIARAPAAVGFGAAEGVVAGGMNAAGLKSSMEGMPESERDKSPVYKALASIHGKDKAWKLIADQAASDLFGKTTLSTGAIGALTGGGALGQAYQKATIGAGGGIFKTALKGSASEFVQETPQSGAEKYIENITKQEYLDPSIQPSEGVLSDALTGGAIGAFTGGIVGGGSAVNITPSRQAQILKEKDRLAKEHAEAVNRRNAQQGHNDVLNSGSVDEAIQAANESVSRNPVTKDDVLRTIDPTLADIERLTGLKPSESIEQAINQAQQGLSPESIPMQGRQANVAPNIDIAAQKKPASQNDINEYTQLINDVEARKNNSLDTWTESDEEMLSLAKEKLNSIKGNIYEEKASQETSSKKIPRVLGNSTEIVLPDNTTLPAQWEIVDADNIKATIKEGVNQPRDRTRASSDVQIQEISNNLDYRRLSDSPVLDIGAPAISHDGLIVAGNGRFEAISLAHDKGMASNYLSALASDAANKGIDPAVIESMKKPVLVRRITQPYDTRKLAIDSNAGTSLQYSGMELAKIDAERMKGIEDLDITDTGDIALTGSNISKLKQSLGDYNNTELASLVDKSGALSQDGVRRVRNSLLAKAYGDSGTLGRLVESTDNDARNVLGALTRSAGVVAKVRLDIKAGAIPKELDITSSLLDAVETLSQIRSKGQPLEQYLAQDNLFGDDIDADSKEILKFLHDNIRSQKKLTAFIKDVYGQISNIDQSTEDIFGDNVIPSKQDVIQNAKQSTEGQTAEQQDIFAKQPGQANEQATQTKASDAGSSKEGWVIRKKATGEAIFQTYDQKKVDALNTDKYEAVPTRIHLYELNDPNSKARQYAERPGQFKKDETDEELKFSRSPEERIKDRERSRQLQRHFKAAGHEFTIEARDVRLGATQNGRGQEAATTERLSKIFGRRVVWIDAQGDFRLNGVIIPSIKDTIFINVATEKYAHAVLGHELSHHMERDVPQVYRDMVKALMPLIRDTDAYRETMELGDDMKENNVIKEIVGDLMGDNFTDQEFWDKVAEYNPSAFRKIADTIISWLKNLVVKAKSRGLGSERWVTDVLEAQDIIANAVAQYKNVDATPGGNKDVSIAAKLNRASSKELTLSSFGDFKTGSPITFNYLHNKESATSLFGKPTKESKFGRQYEPYGKYVINVSDDTIAKQDLNKYEYGELSFNNPLVIDNNNLEWKKELSDTYGGKTGKQLSKALIADGYDGVVTVDKYGTSEILDLTSFNESKAKFSKAKIENTLIAQHNLTTKNLIYADRMGGLAAPSIAVTDKVHPLKGFGEITLLSEKDMVDPKKGAKIFGSDIYSPRYPQLSYDFSKEALKKLNQKLSEGIEKTGSSKLYRETLEDDPAHELKRNAAAMYQFLKESNETPDIKYIKEKTIDTALKPFAEGNRNRFDLANDNEFRNVVKDLFLKISSKESLNDGQLGNIARSYADDVIAYHDSKRNVGKVSQKETKSALSKQIDDKGLMNKFEVYIVNLIDSANPAERIFQGYTNSGKRKYIPHTIDNVIKILKKELRGGENFKYGLGSVRSKYSPQFKSIEQIRSSKDRLMDSKSFELVKKELNDDLNTLSEDVNKYGTYSGLDNVENMLSDAAKMGVSRSLTYNGFENVPDGIKLEIDKFIGKLRNMPTEYFEAKILRSVSIGEFDAAIIPDDSPKQVKDILNKNGIEDIREYKSGDNEDRVRKINEVDRLMFSRAEKIPETINIDGVDRPTRNSEGKLIHPNEDGIRNFWEWFGGDSKVVDGQGRPRVFYHGTGAIFDKFSNRESDFVGRFGSGFYFSELKKVANFYAENSNKENKSIMPFYLKINNPINIGKTNFTNFKNGLIEKEAKGNSYKYDQLIGKSNQDLMSHFGYDGLIFEFNGLMQEIVAYDPNQIKSAIGNTGSFSSDNDDIKFSKAEKLYSKLQRVIADAPDKMFSTGKQTALWLQANHAKLNVKKEELHWNGVLDWLQTQGKVSKADVLEYLNTGGVQVEERALAKNVIDTSMQNEEIPRQKFDGYYDTSGNYETEAVEFDGEKLTFDGGYEFYLEDQGNHIYEGDGYYWAYEGYELKQYRDNPNPVIEEFDGDSKFAEYVPPGGKPGTYRELLLTLPSREKYSQLDKYEIYGWGDDSSIKESFETSASAERRITELRNDGHRNISISSGSGSQQIGVEDFTSSHFEQENVIVHLRVDEVEGASGELLLRVIEVQSDWNKQGDEQGFVGQKPADEASLVEKKASLAKESDPAKRHAISKQIAKLEKRLRDDIYNVPVAPFVADTQSYISIALKKAIIYAAQNGMDGIVFAAGQQNADFYDLSKQVSKVIYQDDSQLIAFDLENNIVLNEPNVAEDKLQDYIGKEVALKLIESKSSGGKKQVSGLDLKVGGEGMLKFYDEIIPQVASKVLKQISADTKVATIDLAEIPENEKVSDRATWEKTLIGFKITPDLHAKVMQEGLPLFSRQEKQKEPLMLESKFRKFQRFWQDDFNRFIAMKEWLADRGINLSEQADVSRAEERYHSKVANQIEDFNDFVARPLIEKIAKAGFSMSDVADYLEAQHAEEANSAIAKLHKDPSMIAYGITNDEAEDYLSQAPKELGVLANEFRNITEQTKKLLLDERLRSQEEVDAWEAAYKYYIPVKGADQPIKGTGKGLAVHSKTKRRLGHGRRDEAVIENILLDHERAIMEVEGNRVAKHLGMMAAEIAIPELMTIGQPVKRNVLKNAVAYEVQVKGVTKAVFDSREGANVFKQMLPATDKKIAPSEITINPTRDQRIISSASPMLAENEINMYIDGHAIRIQINDEIAARAYKHLGIEGYGHLVAAGRAINGYLSKAYTGYAPEWGISNIIRDFTAGIINLTGEEGIVMAARAVKNYPGSFASLLRYAFTGRKKSSKWIDMYRANGGNTGAAWLPDMERLSNDVASEYAAFQGVISNLKQGDMANASRAALRKLHNVFLKWLNNLNQASENAMRLAAFKAMIESGKSVNEASHIAKNITINFNKKGEFGQTANAAYLFFNATMNGQAAMNHALFKGRHKYQAWALGGAGLTALGYTIAMMLGGGDEDEYDKLDDYTKERNMVIKAGDGWIKIPVPYGHGFFWSLGRSIADAQRKDELGTLPWHIASSAIEELTPFGNIVVGADEEFKSDQVLLGLLPTVAQIAVQPALNKSIFSGGEMMPESPFDKSQPDREKMWRGTKGTMYDKTSGWLEDAGIDVSPETLKHLTRSATGGAGATADAVISAAMLKIQGAEMDANEVPFVRKLYHEPTIRSDRAAFHKAREDARTAAEEFRRAKRDNDLVSISKILKDKKEMLMLDNYANKLQKFINVERDKQDAVRTNESIPIAERRLKLKVMEVRESKFYDQYLDVFKIKKLEMKNRPGD